MRVFSLSIISLLALACNSVGRFEATKPIENGVWALNDTFSVDVDITDTNTYFTDNFIVRHTADYNYTNLWLGRIHIRPNGKVDTMSIPLALGSNANASWNGNCVADVCEIMIPMKRNIQFKELGKHTFKFIHINRIGNLEEVLTVGYRLEKQ